MTAPSRDPEYRRKKDAEKRIACAEKGVPHRGQRVYKRRPEQVDYMPIAKDRVRHDPMMAWINGPRSYGEAASWEIYPPVGYGRGEVRKSCLRTCATS